MTAPVMERYAVILARCEADNDGPAWGLTQDGVEHALHWNANRTDWWYASNCCDVRKPKFNLRGDIHTFISAMERFDLVLAALAHAGDEYELCSNERGTGRSAKQGRKEISKKN